LILLLCMVTGFRPQHFSAVVSGFGFVAMIAICFAALGMIIGSTLKDMQSFNVVANFMVMPMVFLSGAFYPLDNLPLILSVLTRINPLSYGVDGLRGTLIGHWHFNYFLDMTLLSCVGAVFLIAGAYSFSKIEI